MECSSLSLMLSLALISSVITHIGAQPLFTCVNCTNSRGNYTSTSSYSKNLKKLLSSLSTNTNTNNRFYKLMVGQVYGMAYCRADLSDADCNSCINGAAKQLPGECPTQKEAIGYYISKCMLRYSDRPIFGIKELSPACSRSDKLLIPDAQVDMFRKTLAILLGKLRNNASAGDSRHKFATGSENVTATLPLYGLMQCNPHLSHSDCSSCLQAGIRHLQICCNSTGGASIYGPICAVQYGNYQFLNMPSTPSSVPSHSAPNKTQQEKRKNTHKSIIIIIGVLFVTLMLFATFVLSSIFRRKKLLKEKVQNNVQIECVDSLQFDFNTIQVATDNFSNCRRLGRGSSTILYKGILPNEQEIAVKRVSKDGRYSELQFNNEVLLLAELQHRNLVKLLGYCIEKNSRLLVYEYLPNKSLDLFLHDPVKRAMLDWETRQKIILGIARGVLYLHEDSHLRVIHRDLKPSNILLDVDMNPKISNFSKAGLVQADQTRGDSSTVLGTYGYMPPEYVDQGHFSVKSDVFSFGVLLLEIINGQFICSFSGEEGESLPSFVWRKWFDGKALEAVDQQLPNIEKHTTQIMRCINIALLCVQENPTNRPTMSAVVFMLNSNLVTLALPSKPAFYFSGGMSDLHSSCSSSLNHGSNHHSSVNKVSISELDPR